MGTVTARACTAVTILPNTDSPMRSGRTGRAIRARTGTARETESTAAPTVVTIPAPSDSPPAPSPALTVTESPPCIAAASGGVTLKTMSRAAAGGGRARGGGGGGGAARPGGARRGRPPRPPRAGAFVRETPRLHEPQRPRVGVLRALERGLGALRRGIEGRALERDERVAFRDPLAGSDEDGRHARGGGRRELGEPSGPGHHRADGPHDLGEGLHRRHGGRGADDGLSGGRRAGLGVLAVGAGPAGREQRGGRAEQRDALHGWSAPVRSRKAAAASFAAATSSM